MENEIKKMYSYKDENLGTIVVLVTVGENPILTIQGIDVYGKLNKSGKYIFNKSIKHDGKEYKEINIDLKEYEDHKLSTQVQDNEIRARGKSTSSWYATVIRADGTIEEFGCLCSETKEPENLYEKVKKKLGKL